MVAYGLQSSAGCELSLFIGIAFDAQNGIIQTVELLEACLIVGTGIDIAEIARFEKFVKEDNQALFKRLFTDFELDYCMSKRFSARPLAMRFAAKEAFLKALGTGLRDGINWLDIEIRNDGLGKPHLFISGKAAEQMALSGGDKCHLSMSDDGGFAIAQVILEGR